MKDGIRVAQESPSQDITTPMHGLRGEQLLPDKHHQRITHSWLRFLTPISFP